MRDTRPLALLVLTALACRDAAHPPPAVAQDTAARRARSAQIAGQRQSVIAEAAARVAPAVVSVNVLRRVQRMARDPFEWFLMPRGAERLVEGVGSGFIISADGVVITNQHVTQGADQIVVTTREGQDYPAKLLGEDPLTDIAVLKVEGDDLPVAPVGGSHDLVIGEWVVAIGNPYAYLLGNTEPSVTAGVVSATNRNLLPSGDQQGVYVGMIQTDAAINPGNSGGPLVNALGEVVGVNSSIFSTSGGSIGIGFAIPIERAVRVADELRRHGAVRRAWAGLDVAGADDLRDWKRAGGLKVTAVAPGGPAARAGIAEGDVLVEAQGRRIRTFLDWEGVLLDTGPGSTLSVTFRRGSTGPRTARIAMTDLPTSVAEKVAVLDGLKVITLTPAVRQERDVQSERGALVYEVSPAVQRLTALRPGDVIFQADRTPVTSADDLERAIAVSTRRGAVTLWFERRGATWRSTFPLQ